MRDGQATRRRILDAATAEFAHRGIAGARVDRIVTDAHSNKSQLYAYFTSKDGLFDAVFAHHLDAILNAVPLTGDDLPGYAARLYDAHLAQPEFVRLAGWARLERIPTGDLIPDPTGHEAKLRTITDAQRAGLVDPTLQPADVLATVIAVAMTWSALSIVTTAGPADPATEHEHRRRTIRDMVHRMTT